MGKLQQISAEGQKKLVTLKQPGICNSCLLLFVVNEFVLLRSSPSFQKGGRTGEHNVLFFFADANKKQKMSQKTHFFIDERGDVGSMKKTDGNCKHSPAEELKA